MNKSNDLRSIRNGTMNAACSVAKSAADIAALSETNIDVVLIGSVTVHARGGNEEPRWYATKDYSLNSFGLPNKGLDYYRQSLPKMARSIATAKKLSVLSVAGFSADEYVKLATLAQDSNINCVELNFGCPSVLNKDILSFDIATMRLIIEAVTSQISLPLMVKLSPYSNPAELARVAEMINDMPVCAVVTMNSFPNSYISRSSNPVLASEYGGMGGNSVLPIALGQVRQFREQLRDEIMVIGVGGVETKQDAQLFYDAGAQLVQAATLIVREGHDAINRLK